METITTNSVIKNNSLITCDLELSVDIGNQNVAENYTTVNYQYKVTCTSAATFTGTARPNAGSLVIKFDGVAAKTVVVPLDKGLANGTIIVQGSGSYNVTHNADGTKSCTYSLEMVSGTDQNKNNYVWNPNSATSNLTFQTINRASTISASNTNMGTATTITITRAASTFTHTLTYSFGNSTGTITTKTTSISVSWNPSVSLASQIPNALSGSCTITCDTYSGDNKVGTKTCTITLSVPASVKPTLTSLTATRVDESVPTSWGIYVQNISKVKLSINGAAGIYGSTISSYSIVGDDFSSTSSSFTTGVLTKSGTVTFTAKVTDSRGRTSDPKTVSITVVEYAVPSVSSYLSQRANSDGNLNDDGVYIHGQVAFTFSSCSNKNSVTTAIYFKKSTDTTWTNANISFSSGVAFLFGSGNISTEYSYDVKYVLTDTFTTVNILDTVSTAAVLMDFKAGGKGIAIGKVSEKNALEIAFDTYHSKPIYSEYIDLAIRQSRLAQDGSVQAKLGFGIGSNGINRGIYDDTRGNWIIYRNSLDNSNTVLTGSTTINGSLKINNHDSAIGTIRDSNSSTAASINSGSWTSSRSTLTLTTGVYMISASVYFGTKENGRRGVRIITSVDDGATYTVLSHSVQMIGASNTNSLIYVNTSAIIGVTTESMIIKLQGYQDTGAALNITNSYLRAVRIQ